MTEPIPYFTVKFVVSKTAAGAEEGLVAVAEHGPDFQVIDGTKLTHSEFEEFWKK
jgi:hypothetical protein